MTSTPKYTVEQVANVWMVFYGSERTVVKSFATERSALNYAAKFNRLAVS